MAGQIINGCAFDYCDGEGSAVVKGRAIRWEFHEYLGPIFLRADGEPMKSQPGEGHGVWRHFEAWLPKYQAARAKAKANEIVKC